ncbi:hypothetical protein SDC9_158469 [bioreactor metagenome]|uniref:Uncharacterized protein n=1 Tax=bioreactor metagenome TaxID=1076179 RepID=A0A645F9W6_9ZZZZ
MLIQGLLRVRYDGERNVHFSRSLGNSGFCPLYHHHDLDPLVFEEMIGIPVFQHIELAHAAAQMSQENHRSEISFQLRLEIFTTPILHQK